MALPSIAYLTDIYFECGAIRLLPELIERFALKRPLIVTDRGLVSSGLVSSKLAVPGIDLPVFDAVETNPSEESAIAGLKAYREHGCDGIVAFGGGSPLDLAKIVAMLAEHPLPLEQYAILRGGTARITPRIPPLIAIPTTAGSGSEVGRAALLTLSGGSKLGFLSPHLLPRAVICDPELTVGMPPLLTAGAGMDAISHCIETFCSPRVNSVADAIALDGLARGFQNLERACKDGRDLQARSEMMLCSLHGGLAFQKGLGAVHSLSHPLGALSAKRLHHGTLNAVFLPHVLRFNQEHCKPKLEAIALRLGIADAARLPALFTALNQRLGLPADLRTMGLTATDLEPLAEKAFADHCTPTNPRPLNVEACGALYAQAL